MDWAYVHIITVVYFMENNPVKVIFVIPAFISNFNAEILNQKTTVTIT